MKKQNVFKALSRHVCDSLLIVSVVALGLTFTPVLQGVPAAQASTEVADTCDRVARIVSNETGVPLDVLRAITRTETGRAKNGALAPWPWTVNMEGKGVWFDSRQEALAYVHKHFAAGARSFDVGCFQLNYRWHGQHFTDVTHMFEPVANARYAADFLSRLYAEKQNWDDAAAAYHSRTPKYAKKYKARFQRIMANLPDPGTMPLAPVQTAKPLVRTAAVVRENNFPLLQRGNTAGAMGSLFPGRSGAARPFLGNGG
jgi:hypothetical protein